MQHEMVDLVIVGADRVTAQGDVCNKIGTYLKALAAHDNSGAVLCGRCRRRPSISRLRDGLPRFLIEQRAARRSRDHDRQNERRSYRDGADRARWLSGRKLCFRRHARRVSSPGLITERGVIAANRAALAQAFPERAEVRPKSNRMVG